MTKPTRAVDVTLAHASAAPRGLLPLACVRQATAQPDTKTRWTAASGAL